MTECFTIYADEIENRFNPYYYKPYFKDCVKELSRSKFRIVELKKICKKITDGTHFTPKYIPDGVPFLSVKDIRENKISFENTKFISTEEHQNLIKRCKPEAEDILLTKVGTIGLAAVIPKDSPEFSIFVSVALLKIDKDKANPYYISVYLNSKFAKFQIDRILKGISVPDLHLENIAQIKIILPPLEIQNKIAELMNRKYEQKSKKENDARCLIDEINDYVIGELGIKLPELKDKMAYVISFDEQQNKRIDPYYYQPKFDEVEKAIKRGKYEIKELKEIVNKIESGQRPKGGVRQISEGIPSLGGEHVLSDGTIATSDLKYIPKEFHEKQLKSKVQKKDIIIVKDGATTGKIGIVPENYPIEEVNINEHVFLVRVKENANPYYIFSILKSQLGQIQINREITGGTIMGIIRETIEAIKIPLPPLAVQNKIAEEVKSRMKKAEQLQKEAKEELEKAKKEVEKKF